MNHANHPTVLVYVYEGGELEVGTVTCVPRKGDIVELRVPDLYGDRYAHRVEQVVWSPVYASAPGSESYAVSYTVARVSLSRCT